jgi:hypothetical protein
LFSIYFIPKLPPVGGPPHTFSFPLLGERREIGEEQSSGSFCKKEVSPKGRGFLINHLIFDLEVSYNSKLNKYGFNQLFLIRVG